MASEELKLTINLTDDASAGVALLRTRIEQLTEEAADSTNRLKRYAGDLQDRIKSFSQEGGKSVDAVGLLAKGLGIAAGAVAGFGISLVYGVEKFAQTYIALNTLSKETGLLPGQLKSLQEQLAGYGIPLDAANSNIRGFQKSLADLTKRGISELRAKLIAGAGRDPAARQSMENLIRRIIGLGNAGQTEEAMSLAIEAANNVFNNAIASGKSAAAAAEDRNSILNLLGMSPDILSVKGTLRTATAEEEARAQRRIELSYEWEREWSATMREWDNFKAGMQTGMLPILIEMNKAVRGISEGTGKILGEELGNFLRDLTKGVEEIAAMVAWFKLPMKDKAISMWNWLKSHFNMGAAIEQTNADALRRLQERYNEIAPAGTPDANLMPAKFGDLGEGEGETEEELDEQNKAFVDLIGQFRRLNDMIIGGKVSTQMGGLAPGMGGGYGFMGGGGGSYGGGGASGGYDTAGAAPAGGGAPPGGSPPGSGSPGSAPGGAGGTGASGATYAGGGNVMQMQQQVASIRRQAIQDRLNEQLEYAGGIAGVNVEVTSGGQAGIGTPGAARTGSTRHDHGGAADLKLRDAATGRLLDMRNPEDAARMAQFTEHAVRAGATGVGAGMGYMGANTLHIGGGKAASWGGADWVGGALQRGLASGQMTRQQVQAALAERRKSQSDAGADRGVMDKGMGNEVNARTEAKGKLQVDVKAPAGTKVTAEGKGVLGGKTEVNRSTPVGE